jgi:hypothetical protein
MWGIEMPANIKIESMDERRFRVTITGDGSKSSHVVTLQPEYYQKLTSGKISAEELLRRSFEFLLEREPKESILTAFELPVIGRYFPEYEAAMKML